MNEKAEWTRQAIDVMTAWSASGCDSRFAANRVAAYAGEEPAGAMKLTVDEAEHPRHLAERIIVIAGRMQ
ncbi:hypothetical protein [Mycolicibacterium sarraceniae]|nr:hypothetical protein [Mycolicibacterium sarraceniae]